MDYDNKLNSYKERFVRWQQLTISHLSYTNNLFIGLNLGFTGFFVSKFNFTFECDLLLFSILTIALICLGTSFVSGNFVVLSRLKDFRKTTQLINRQKQKYKIENNNNQATNYDSINSDILSLKKETNSLGKKTWMLLHLQIWSFMIGTILGIIYIIITKGTYS